MTTLLPGAKRCEILEWDSDFFGYRLARYRGPRFLHGDAAALLEECEEQNIDGVYILLDAADTESIVNVQRTGALLTDVRVTFATEIERPTAAIGDRSLARIRPATPADVPALAQIASVSHRDTRFYADRHFDVARCNRLYAVWIENSCRGYADAVLVVEDPESGPTGYVTCHKSATGSQGHIGLFAIDERVRGRGTGHRLLTAALHWFEAHEVSAITIATQLRNGAALRFYGRAGLQIACAEIWFHFWRCDVCA